MVDAESEHHAIEVPNYRAISQRFAQELADASQGKETSLPFIKNPLPERPLIQPNQMFQGFVIGGTNGATAVALAGENETATILEQKDFRPLPKFATKDDFLGFIDENLDPQAQAIGLNMAYTLIPVVGENHALEGLLNQGDTKGSAFEGLQQEQVGKTVSEHIKETTGRDVVTSAANDTVNLILAGLEADTNRGNLIAAIVGTGYNVALFSDHNTVVNLQSSDFTGFQQTESGKIVDEQSKNRGEQIYNKEVAAGELYKHFNALIPLLHLDHTPLTASEELSVLAKDGNGAEAQVARELFGRSAGLVAAHFAGIYEFKGKPKQLTVITQGSLMEDNEYKGTILKDLKALGVPEDAMRFKKVENSDIKGALKLVTG